MDPLCIPLFQLADQSVIFSVPVKVAHIKNTYLYLFCYSVIISGFRNVCTGFLPSCHYPISSVIRVKKNRSCYTPVRESEWIVPITLPVFQGDGTYFSCRPQRPAGQTG